MQVHVGAIKEGDYSGVAEVSKYCVKPLELSNNDDTEQNRRALLILMDVLKGTRMVQKYGVIREAFNALKDDDAADMQNPDKGTSGTAFLQWDDVNMKYMEC